MLMKRRRKNTLKKTSVFKESLEEFRNRFLDVLKFKGMDWKDVFSSSDLISSTRWSQKTNPEIVQSLLEYESVELRRLLIDKIMDRVEVSNGVFSKRVKMFMEPYYDSDVEISFSTVEGIIDRFFSSKLSKTKKFIELRRKEEEELLREVEPLSHVHLLNVRLPIDVVNIIMSFLPHNSSLICGLGCVNEKWFRIVLQTWKKLRIWSNYMKIPRLVLESARFIAFEGLNQKKFEERREYYRELRKDELVDLEYVFSNINHYNIRTIDFTGLYYEFRECYNFYIPPASKISIDFPNLEGLVLPMRSGTFFRRTNKRVTDCLELKNLSNLRHLKCDIRDLHLFDTWSNSIHVLELFFCVRSCDCPTLDRLDEKIESSRTDGCFTQVKDVKIMLFCCTGYANEEDRHLINDGKYVNKKLDELLSSSFFFPNGYQTLVFETVVTGSVPFSLDLAFHHEHFESQRKLNKLHLCREIFLQKLELPCVSVEEFLVERSVNVRFEEEHIHEVEDTLSRFSHENSVVSIETLFLDFFILQRAIEVYKWGKNEFHIETNSTVADKLVPCTFRKIFGLLLFDEGGVVVTSKVVVSVYVEDDLMFDLCVDVKKNSVVIRILSEEFFGKGEEEWEEEEKDGMVTYLDDKEVRREKRRKLFDELEDLEEKNYQNVLKSVLIVGYLQEEERMMMKKEWKWILKSQQDEKKRLKGFEEVLFEEEICDDEEYGCKFVYFLE